MNKDDLALFLATYSAYRLLVDQHSTHEPRTGPAWKAHETVRMRLSLDQVTIAYTLWWQENPIHEPIRV